LVVESPVILGDIDPIASNVSLKELNGRLTGPLQGIDCPGVAGTWPSEHFGWILAISGVPFFRYNGKRLDTRCPVPWEDNGEKIQPMKYEPPDEGMDERQKEQQKLAKAEREQVKKDRDAQRKKMRKDRITAK
jgi:hypothetical protein